MATTNDQRWAVAFAGARDSYQVPIALYESGLLEKLVTDFYAPLDRPFLTATRNVLPSAIDSKLSRRFSPSLPSRFVDSHLLYALKNWSEPETWMHRVDSLGQRAGSIAAEKRCSIVAYSHLATSAFAVAGIGRKVLIQMQPHPAAVRAALQVDKFLPEFQDETTNELSWSQQVFDRFSQEPQLADLCIVASTYTRSTLVENNVDADLISVIPYGVDLEFFSPARAQSEKFSVLFVGQLCRQKGLHYLLEAWRRLGLQDADLRIVGRFPSKRNALSNYASKASFLGPLSWDALREEYRQADVLCLPSLSDGFGQVILEAMACGTPALTTTSCGASDLIQQGNNGWVISAADLDSLISSLEWASKNRDKLREMRSAARATAEQYPWSKFRKNIVEQLRSLTIHGK